MNSSANIWLKQNNLLKIAINLINLAANRLVFNSLLSVLKVSCLRTLYPVRHVTILLQCFALLSSLQKNALSYQNMPTRLRSM